MFFPLYLQKEYQRKLQRIYFKKRKERKRERKEDKREKKEIKREEREERRERESEKKERKMQHRKHQTTFFLNFKNQNQK